MSSIEMFQPIDTTEYKRWEGAEKGTYANYYIYEECTDRVTEYTKEEWTGVLKRGEDILKRLADNMDQGPSDNKVQEITAQYRKYINDCFFPCTTDIFRTLGEKYKNDPGFIENVNIHNPGLAEFLSNAINIYCDGITR